MMNGVYIEMLSLVLIVDTSQFARNFWCVVKHVTEFDRQRSEQHRFRECIVSQVCGCDVLLRR